jgi:uncharacterized protein (DUF2249 family)
METINKREVFLDLRGLEPPEPMERVLHALGELLPGQHVRLLIERVPHPLFRILERNDYRHTMSEAAPGLYAIVIAQQA